MTTPKEIVDRLKDKNIALVADNGQLRLVGKKPSLTPDLLEIVRGNKAALLSYLTSYPLSLSQQGLWFIDAKHDGTAYNIFFGVDVRGHFDVALAELAFSKIIERHQILGVVYELFDYEPRQRVCKHGKFSIVEHDFSHLAGCDRDNKIAGFFEEHSRRPFDLASDCMFRADFIHVDKDNAHGMLVLCFHHIATDAWSTRIWLEEFVELYTSLQQDKAPRLKPLEAQYVDYALWQREFLKSDELNHQLSYWEKQLANAPLHHSLPFDKIPSKEKTFESGVVSMRISETLTDQVRLFAQEKSISVFMFVHAFLSLVLSRYSNSHDIFFGSPIANRRVPEYADLIGMFVNTLVLRVNTDHEKFTDYIHHIRQVHLEAHQNQDMPFEYLVNHLDVKRFSEFTPVFQTCITMAAVDSNLTNARKLMESIPGVSVDLIFGEESFPAKFDLSLNVSINEGSILVEWIFDKNRFHRSTIERLADEAVHLFELVVENPEEDMKRFECFSTLPSSPTEISLANIVAELHDVAYQKISSNVDIFTKNSPQEFIAKLILRINTEYGIDIDRKTIYSNPSIKDLSKIIDSELVSQYLSKSKKDIVVQEEGEL